MKTKISTLGDLSDFLQSLKVKQLDQPIKVLPESIVSRLVHQAEITEEPFLVNGNHVGYPSELRRELGTGFNVNDFEILEPVGTVILYVKD